MSRLLLPLLLAPSALAQLPVFDSMPPAQISNRTGFAVALAGDFNGDCFDDLLVSGIHHMDLAGQNVGRVVVYSGRDRAVLAEFHASSPQPGNLGDYFGWAVCGIGDLDGDGRAEIAVGAHQNGSGPGYVEIFNSTSPTAWLRIEGGSPGDRFGFAISKAGDFDGDLVPDLLVTAPTEDAAADLDVGAVRVVSGAWIAETAAGGTPVRVDPFVTFGENQGDNLGFAVAGPLDANGDGIDDFLTSQFTVTASNWGFGTVRLHAGGSGEVLFLQSSPTQLSRFGYDLAPLSDQDGDGLDDFAVLNAFDIGVVTTFSGRTGEAIHNLTPSSVDALASLLSISRAGDLNDDGVEDLIGGRAHVQGFGFSDGHVIAWSGLTGEELWEIHGNPGSGMNLGFDVAYCGDLLHSGDPVLLVGAPSDSAVLPSSGEDIVLQTAVGNQEMSGVAVKDTAPGNLLRLQVSSPTGAFVGHPPIVVGQVFRTGMPPDADEDFPVLHVDFLSPGFLTFFDGTLTDVFGGLLLMPDGLTLGEYRLPPILTGRTVRIQAGIVSPAAKNGLFATSNAMEIVIR